MSFTISAFNHDDWNRYGLSDFSEFADQITEVNVSEDSFSGFGEWFFVPNDPLSNGDRVIYYGSWGNDNSPGASMYTNAEIFDALDPDQRPDSRRGPRSNQRPPGGVVPRRPA